MVNERAAREYPKYEIFIVLRPGVRPEKMKPRDADADADADAGAGAGAADCCGGRGGRGGSGWTVSRRG
jgi:hypothetical protein